MKTTRILLAAVALLAACSVFAEYTVQNRGTWPDTWPKELEPLRKQSRTLDGPIGEQFHYQIPFSKREEFEAAWPHLLKAKGKAGPLFLKRAPYTRLGHIDAGVVLHTPMAPGQNQVPIEQLSATDRTSYTNYMELIVDGNIVDLNRIPLPADTPIVDDRFAPDKPAPATPAPATPAPAGAPAATPAPAPALPAR
jgi:hypothetical protein